MIKKKILENSFSTPSSIGSKIKSSQSYLGMHNICTDSKLSLDLEPSFIFFLMGFFYLNLYKR